MFKKILIFSLYFYFAGQRVDADDGEQLQRQLNDFLNTNVERSDNDVPAYKFLRITSHEKTLLPSQATISFNNSYGEFVTLQLYLVERNVMSQDLECWIMTTNNKTNFNLDRIDRNAFLLSGSFYQSINPRGMFYSSQCGNNSLYYGVYGEGAKKRVIEPIPNNLQYKDITNFADHIEYTMNPVTPTPTTITIPVPEENTDSLKYLKNQPNRGTPLTNLYPKLLLIIDGAYYTKFKDVYSIVRYLSVIFNIVGLEYDEIPSPKIKPLVTGIIIARNEDTLEGFLTKNSAVDSTYKDANYTLQQYYSFKLELAKKLDQFKNYDSSLLMTPYTGIVGNQPIYGLAFISLICSDVVGYITDHNINFEGVNVVIHELAHMLGADHDNPQYLKDYQNQTFQYSENDLYLSWSNMSIKYFQTFAEKEIASCLSDP